MRVISRLRRGTAVCLLVNFGVMEGSSYQNIQVSHRNQENVPRPCGKSIIENTCLHTMKPFPLRLVNVMYICMQMLSYTVTVHITSHNVCAHQLKDDNFRRTQKQRQQARYLSLMWGESQ